MKKVCTLALALIYLLCLGGATYQYTGAETELIALINNERDTNGLPSLTINWEVARLAHYKSEEMIKHQLFCHESLVYGNPAQILDRFHIQHNMVGANIAMGYNTPQEVMASWLGSPGHHANLVNPNFTSIGVGLSLDKDGIPYWTIILIAE